MILLGIIELMAVAYRIRLNDSNFASISFGPNKNSIMLVNISLMCTETFLTFPACFLIPISLSNLNSNCSNLLDMRNLQEQAKKTFCYQKLF